MTEPLFGLGDLSESKKHPPIKNIADKPRYFTKAGIVFLFFMGLPRPDEMPGKFFSGIGLGWIFRKINQSLFSAKKIGLPRTPQETYVFFRHHSTGILEKFCFFPNLGSKVSILVQNKSSFHGKIAVFRNFPDTAKAEDFCWLEKKLLSKEHP